MQPDMNQVQKNITDVRKTAMRADKPAMEVRDLSFSYGKNKVLKGIKSEAKRS